MGVLKEMSAFWSRRSLKFWLATGMLMTCLPFFISVVAGYHLYHRAIIDPLVEVSSKQRHILQPLQDMQLMLWNVSDSVVDYAIDGKSVRANAFKRESAQVNTDFAQLVTAVEGHATASGDVRQAWTDWREVAARSNAILSGNALHGDRRVGEEVEAFESIIDSLGCQLAVVYDDVRVENEEMHERALMGLERLDAMSTIGFALSIVFAGLGVLLINRSLVKSMDQLAMGAMRLAAGDREHQVEVHIPHELVNVANAFNMMTSKILEQEKALELAAITDGLTGLFNRREFDRVLAEEVRRGERYGAPVSLVICDVDHFKAFNDTYGHPAGDDVLRAVARVLKGNVRDLDRACRFGGEEFAVILPQSSLEAARETAERMRAAVEILDFPGNSRANVTISLGIAAFPDHGATPEALVKSADAALYTSKENGRNQVTTATME